MSLEQLTGIMIIIIGILIFSIILLFILGGYSTLNAFRKQEVKKRLSTISGEAKQEISIIRTRVLSDIPWFNNILLRIPRIEKIHGILEQADIRLSMGSFTLLSLLLGFSGLLYILKDPLLGVLGTGFLGMSPTFYILYRKRKRIRHFERQLPEALELVSRAIRAGHAFSPTLQMVAHELRDPIGAEFRKTFVEINYGVSVPEALKNLANRVDSKDLRFFVTSVIIQWETGGNLAEILESIAYIIRERFKLLGKFKALSAEGKYSAWVLSLLPFIMFFILYIINRDYILILVSDPWGKKITALALVWLCLGIFIMRRMIKIKV